MSQLKKKKKTQATKVKGGCSHKNMRRCGESSMTASLALKISRNGTWSVTTMCELRKTESNIGNEI